MAVESGLGDCGGGYCGFCSITGDDHYHYLELNSDTLVIGE